MKDDGPASLEAAAGLRQLLQQLGQEEPPAPRVAEEENERETRMAARMEAELRGLVEARRSSRRVWLGFAAVAAALAITAGLQRARSGTSSLAITHEPLAPSGAHPRPRAAAPLPRPAPEPAPSAPPRRMSSPPTPVASPGSASSAEPRSTLGEENQLFKDAAEATRNGDVKGALSGLDKLLVEHPRSPLAQTALVRKFRLLAKAGQADAARREAERYLAAYPTGFAVSEAQALVQGQTPLRASPSPAEQQGTP